MGLFAGDGSSGVGGGQKFVKTEQFGRGVEILLPRLLGEPNDRALASVCAGT